jgi:hypothetical protein
MIKVTTSKTLTLVRPVEAWEVEEWVEWILMIYLECSWEEVAVAACQEEDQAVVEEIQTKDSPLTLAEY